MMNNDPKLTETSPVAAVSDAAHEALDVLEFALNQDFQRPDWSSDVMAAAANLCAVMDRLRYTLDGGRLQ